MNTIVQYSGVVALVILAIIGFRSMSAANVFGAACTDGYTCYTNLQVLEDLITSGDQSVTGNQTISGTLSVTGTTTLAQSVVMTEAPGCIEMYATSTATKVKLTFETGSTTPTATGGLLGFAFGNCN